MKDMAIIPSHTTTMNTTMKRKVTTMKRKDSAGARTADEERHQLVGVLFGEPFHLDSAGGVLAERAEVHLRRAVYKTGFVVGSDDEKGLVPAGVLFDSSGNVIDGLHELGGPFNNASGLIGVARPVNGASHNHKECSARVIVKNIQRAQCSEPSSLTLRCRCSWGGTGVCGYRRIVGDQVQSQHPAGS